MSEDAYSHTSVDQFKPAADQPARICACALYLNKLTCFRLFAELPCVCLPAISPYQANSVVIFLKLSLLSSYKVLWTCPDLLRELWELTACSQYQHRYLYPSPLCGNLYIRFQLLDRILPRMIWSVWQTLLKLGRISQLYSP